MESLYKTLIHLSEQNEYIGKNHVGTIEINLTTKNVYCNKHIIMQSGRLLQDTIITDKNTYKIGSLIEIDDLMFLGEDFFDIKGDPYNVMKKLFYTYYSSSPNRFNDQRKKNILFKSLNEMTYEELEQGENRNKAQTMLEGYILLGGLNKWITWDEKSNFFTKIDDSFYLFRDWIM